MTETKPKPVIAAAAVTTPSSKPQHPPPKPVSPKVDRGSPVKSYIDPDQADNIGPQVIIETRMTTSIKLILQNNCIGMGNFHKKI